MGLAVCTRGSQTLSLVSGETVHVTLGQVRRRVFGHVGLDADIDPNCRFGYGSFRLASQLFHRQGTVLFVRDRLPDRPTTNRSSAGKFAARNQRTAASCFVGNGTSRWAGRIG